MRVTTETIAEQTALYIQLIEKHGPATATELSEMTTGRRDLPAVEKIRYRLRMCVERGYLIAIERTDRKGSVIYAVNPDKTNRLAVAYTVKEQVVHALEDAIVDALMSKPGMAPTEISQAIGPMKRPNNTGKSGRVAAESIKTICSNLVSRGVLLCDGDGYSVKGGKR